LGGQQWAAAEKEAGDLGELMIRTDSVFKWALIGGLDLRRSIRLVATRRRVVIRDPGGEEGSTTRRVNMSSVQKKQYKRVFSKMKNHGGHRCAGGKPGEITYRIAKFKKTRWDGASMDEIRDVCTCRQGRRMIKTSISLGRATAIKETEKKQKGT